MSIKFRKEKKVNKIMGISIEHNTNNTYENGARYVRIQVRRELRIHVYACNKNTVPKICIDSYKKKQENKEVVMCTKTNTKSTRNTTRKTCTEESTHKQHRRYSTSIRIVEYF